MSKGHISRHRLQKESMISIYRGITLYCLKIDAVLICKLDESKAPLTLARFLFPQWHAMSRGKA